MPELVYKIISIDFDGTITTSPMPSCASTIRPGAVEVITELYNLGARLILNTCRTDVNLDEAIQFLYRHKILRPFESINRNLPDVIKKYKGDSRKIFADVYIDDRNLGAKIDWYDIRKQLIME